jgi:putative tryptophan/tyrosine transport system substrate-binding protein
MTQLRHRTTLNVSALDASLLPIKAFVLSTKMLSSYSGSDMRRRDFITALSGAAAWSIAANAQQPAKAKRIALVAAAAKVDSMTREDRYYRAFFDELGKFGYLEGRNLSVARYSGEGRIDRSADLVREVVISNPDLIFTSGPLALLFKTATTRIPVVALTADPLAIGLVPSIAQPGGNITGVSVDGGLEIYGKRLGLLIEAVPKAAKIGYLASRSHWGRATGAAAQDAARRVGVSLVGPYLDDTMSREAYSNAFIAMEKDRVDALLVADEPGHGPYRVAITELATKTRIPALYPLRDFVDVGGLLAYSIDRSDVFRRLGNVVGQILGGATPGDIPFYQQTKFELIVNLRTAKALSLELPATLIGRADEVLE